MTLVNFDKKNFGFCQTPTPPNQQWSSQGYILPLAMFLWKNLILERFSIGWNCWSLQIVKLRLLSFQIWTFINLSLLSSYWPFTSSQTFIENLAHWKGGNKGRNILIPLSRKFHTNLILAILKFKQFSNTPFWLGHTLGKYRMGLGLVKSKMKYVAKFTISLPCAVL